MDKTSEEKEIRIKEKKIDSNLRRASIELEVLQKQKVEGAANIEILQKEEKLKEYISWLQNELESIISSKIKIMDDKSDDDYYLQYPIDEEPVRKGLVNVVVDETLICYIDPEAGKLYYRGYNIQTLIEKYTFEEVSFLLLFGKLPSDLEIDYYKKKIKDESSIPNRIISNLKDFPREATRIEILRSSVSTLSLYETPPLDGPISELDNLMRGIRIIAKFSTLVAYAHQIEMNQPFRDPLPELSYAENFLYMINGKKPTPEETKLMDAILILHAEHDLNASAFAARVTISTQSDLYSAIVSAIGTLKGPLHGGANQEVIYAFLNEIKRIDRIEPWLDEKIKNKEKIMGFGHRVYRTMDPRAKILKQLASELFKDTSPNEDYDNLFEMAKKLEDLIFKKKGLYANVDFYSAIVMHQIGIPTSLFVHIFAISRMSGWIAHAIEQVINNKLIRPRMRYVGPIREK
jgi:citrate synthase